MSPLQVVYVFTFALLMLLEGIAIANKRRGDTISESVWMIRSTKVGRFFLWPGLLWLTYHLLIAKPGTIGGVDAAVIGVGLLVATVMAFRDE